MFNLDPAKLLIIAVLAVILLGPDKLPQVARQAGAAWRTFNEFRHRMETEVRSSLPDLPSSQEIARLARSPSALLDRLSSLDGDAKGLNGETAEAANGSAAHESAEASAPERLATGPFDTATGHGPVANGEGTAADMPAEQAAFEGAGDPNLN